MKLKMLMILMVVAALTLFTGNLYAANGDLIVNGNLGVGTSTPSEKAEINGNMKVDQNLTVQGNLITNGSTSLGGNASIQGNLVTSGSAAVGAQLSVGTEGLKFADGSTQTTAKMLIWDYTVSGSAVTSLTSPTLDGNAHGGYEFEFYLKNASSTNVICRLFYNNDQTDANYETGVSGNLGSNTYVGAYLYTTGLPSGGYYRIRGSIGIGPDGQVVANWVAFNSRNWIEMYGHRKLATVSNLTRLDIVANVANSIGVNSRFRLWKKIL